MGNRLSKIYTRTGDDGTTGLGDGSRTPKDAARVEAQLADAEKLLPEDFALEFSRVTKARGDMAMAPVENESCGGCYQRLTAQTTAPRTSQGSPLTIFQLVS